MPVPFPLDLQKRCRYRYGFADLGVPTYLVAGTRELCGLQVLPTIANGIQIINFSIGTYGTSRGDGSGPPRSPEAIVADAHAHGILWVNAAGNAALDHWSGVMNPDSGGYNLFSPGDDANRLIHQAGDQTCVVVKWDAWSGPNYPMTAVLADLNTHTVVDASVGGLIGERPSATVCARNTTGAPWQLGIGVYDGSRTER